MSGHGSHFVTGLLTDLAGFSVLFGLRVQQPWLHERAPGSRGSVSCVVDELLEQTSSQSVTFAHQPDQSCGLWKCRPRPESIQ